MRVLEFLRCRPVAVLCLAAACFAGWLHAEARNPIDLPRQASTVAGAPLVVTEDQSAPLPEACAPPPAATEDRLAVPREASGPPRPEPALSLNVATTAAD